MYRIGSEARQNPAANRKAKVAEEIRQGPLRHITAFHDYKSSPASYLSESWSLKVLVMAMHHLTRQSATGLSQASAIYQLVKLGKLVPWNSLMGDRWSLEFDSTT